MYGIRTLWRVFIQRWYYIVKKKKGKNDKEEKLSARFMMSTKNWLISRERTWRSPILLDMPKFTIYTYTYMYHKRYLYVCVCILKKYIYRYIDIFIFIFISYKYKLFVSVHLLPIYISILYVYVDLRSLTRIRFVADRITCILIYVLVGNYFSNYH